MPFCIYEFEHTTLKHDKQKSYVSQITHLEQYHNYQEYIYNFYELNSYKDNVKFCEYTSKDDIEQFNTRIQHY